jgi:DHA1 family bicyclomycin/chloramphenicol resistance-like MFS transporter
LLTVGLGGSALSSLAILALAHSPWAAVATLLPPLVCNSFCMGMVLPNANQGALHPLPDIAGVASAVMSSSRMLSGALASVLVALLYDGRSAHAMGLMMSFFSVAALGAYLFLVIPRERSPRTAGAEA